LAIVLLDLLNQHFAVDGEAQQGLLEDLEALSVGYL